MTETTIASAFAATAAVIGAFNVFVQKRSEAKKLAAIEELRKADEINRKQAELEWLANKLKLQAVIVTLEKMHSDGNSAMGNVLTLLAKAQRRLATGSDSTPDDLALADQFEARANAHNSVQADIDLRQTIAKAELVRLEKEHDR